jgi:hypothetical protein
MGVKFALGNSLAKKKQQHHTQSHRSVKLLSCTVCDKSYTYKSSLNDHYRKAHTNQNKNKNKKIKHYTCDLCPENATTRKALERHHKQDHLGKRPYLCDVCNKSFLYLSGKNEHIRNIHKDKRLLKTNNQKTISNNDNQNVCQGNNQDNAVKLVDDTDLNEEKYLLYEEQECEEDLFNIDPYDEIVSNYM